MYFDGMGNSVTNKNNVQSSNRNMWNSNEHVSDNDDGQLSIADSE